MLNRFFLLMTSLLLSFLLVAPAAAKPDNYIKQFKPVRIKASLNIPSASAV